MNIKHLAKQFIDKNDCSLYLQHHNGITRETADVLIEFLTGLMESGSIFQSPSAPVIEIPAIDSEFQINAEPSLPDHKGERVVTWNYLERRSKPNNHLHFKWDCPYCGSRKNELNTTIPNGLAEVVCENSECEAFMYLEKLPES